MKMPGVQNFLGMLGHGLLVSAIVTFVLQLRRRRWWFRWTVVLGCFGVALLDVGGIPAVGYTRGLFGDVSITTQLLLACFLLSHLLNRDVLSEQNRKAVLMTTAVTGLVFYPMTLGLTGVDPYGFGFGSLELITLLAVVSLWSGYTRPGAAVFLPLGVIGFNVGLLESANLWDYLLDPFVVGYSWVWLFIQVRRKRQ